jgi:ADP-ribose pyrophosphatase YjhB (NUDIX family)
MCARPSAKKIQDGPYDLPEERLHELVELLEGYGRPFMLTPLKTASKLGLLRRIVLICLKNTRGMVYLQKHTESAPLYAGLWDVSAIGSVFAGESPEDAAERELFQQLGIRGAKLKAMGTLPYTDSRGASLSATFFLAGPSSWRPQRDESRSVDGMFVDQQELEGLALHQQEMLTPELIWAVQAGWIFRKAGGPFLAG